MARVHPAARGRAGLPRRLRAGAAPAAADHPRAGTTPPSVTGPVGEQTGTGAGCCRQRLRAVVATAPWCPAVYTWRPGARAPSPARRSAPAAPANPANPAREPTGPVEAGSDGDDNGSRPGPRPHRPEPALSASWLPAPLWAPGTATGTGSLPGIDARAAAALVVGELPDLPHLVELPDRGPAAGLGGRSTVLLADLFADLQPAGWRLVPRPGLDSRLAADLLDRDLDAFEEAAAGYTGPVKVQVAGPWTLAATLELPRGDKVLADPGAVRDVAQALAEGLSRHVADVGRRLPGARVLVQLDEPALPAVLVGHVRTASGFSTLPTPDEPVATERLVEVTEAVRAAGGVPGLHCCAHRPPVALAVAAGAAFVGLDATLLSGHDDDAVGAAVEAGVGLLLGLVPTTAPAAPMTVAELAAPARALWRRLGFAPERLGEVAAVTPTCGLAGASAEWARSALVAARETARALVEAPEGSAG